MKYSFRLAIKHPHLRDPLCMIFLIQFVQPQGTITGDGKVVVKDSRDGSTPVDLPLDKALVLLVG